MKDDIAKLIESFVAEAKAAAKDLSAKHDLTIEYTHIQQSLVEILHVNSENLPFLKLDKEQILRSTASYNFRKLLPEILAVITLDESVIPLGVPKQLYEQTIRSNGEVWRIHKNDHDPFPSNPHAVNIETGLKLDLSNGNLYKKTTRIDQISKKDLIRIRNKASGIPLPVLMR